VRGLMTLGAAGSDARAREERADRYFEEIIEIAKDSSGDYTEDRNGERVVDHENIQRSRLRVDALKSSARSGCPVAALGWPRASQHLLKAVRSGGQRKRMPVFDILCQRGARPWRRFRPTCAPQSFQNPSNRSERSSVYRTVCMMLRWPRKCCSARVSTPSLANLKPQPWRSMCG
jgi:Bacteriophage Sf6, terminase small subunit-like